MNWVWMGKFFLPIYLFAVTSSLNAQIQLWGMTMQGGQYHAGVIFKTDTSGTNYSVEHDFSMFEGKTASRSQLVEATDGMLYGLTAYGGMQNGGILYQYNPTTFSYTNKVDFNLFTTGRRPFGSLIQASDGMLYGMTQEGGGGDGTIFQYNPISSTCTVKFVFDGGLDGGSPRGSLLQASNGMLYGMTYDGGTNAWGVLFQYDPLTSSFTKILDFNGAGNGGDPSGSLIQASDGKLYGMTTGGGANGFGVIFQYDPTTSTYIKTFDFNGSNNGRNPQGSLMQANDGMLYGMTLQGGSNDLGVLFKYDFNNNNYFKILDFNSTDGSQPFGSLLQANDGMLYGMTSSGGTNGMGVLFQYNPATTLYTKKINFTSVLNGRNPQGTLIQASNSMLYGATQNGGKKDLGTLFQFNITTSTLDKQIDFFLGTDGVSPIGSLIQASDGMLYGMTPGGGTNDYGTLFQFNPTTSVLGKKLDFDGSTNGKHPYGTLIQGNDGKLYGLTSSGGSNNHGVLFEYDILTSTYTKKFDFTTANGSNPRGTLVQINDGSLYGTTQGGGANSSGVIFRYDLATSTYTKKFDFNGTNGAGPIEGLMQASDGMLYGLTENGGVGGNGVLFQFNPVTSSFITKYNFVTISDGIRPTGCLIQASDSMIYGVTPGGGVGPSGVIFQYNPSTSTYRKMKDMYGVGHIPYGSLLQATNGKLYGTTFKGGLKGLGAIFQYNIVDSSLIRIASLDSTKGMYCLGGSLIELNAPHLEVSENSLSKIAKVFPNPSSKQVTIVLNKESKSVILKLINLSGQIVLERKISNNKNISLDISDQPNGLYFLEISDTQHSSKIKIIKN